MAGHAVSTTGNERVIEARVVIRGAAAGLMIAMIAAVANVILAAQDPRPVALGALTLVGLLLGFALAGFVAGYEAPGEVARHGTFAALVVFVPVEVIAILGRLDRGDPVSVFSIVLIAFLAAGAGAGAAPLGAARRVRADERRFDQTRADVGGDEPKGFPS
ncbi:MAG: hypothetical protein ACR2MB_01665 [Acidimicrobiales bacterium]